MATVLVLGGTGAMGVYLVGMLADAGFEVVVTSRRPCQNMPRIRYRVGDAHSLEFLRSVVAFEHPDAIVDFMSYSTEEFASRSKFLLGASSHYLFLSSYRVFAESVPLVETSPRLLDVCDDSAYLATDEYALAKARQENILRKSGSRAWTILRPSITFSRDRFQFGCLEANVVCYRALQGLPVVMPEEMLERRTSLSWGKDVARLIARLVLNPSALGEDFIVATSESHTWKEIAVLYHEGIGMDVQVVPLTTYERICSPYQVRYDRLFDRVIDNRKVLSATGTSQSEFAPLAAGLLSELDSFKRYPVYRSMNPIQNAQIDRICGTRIDFRGFSPGEKRGYWYSRLPWLGNCRIAAKSFVRFFSRTK